MDSSVNVVTDGVDCDAEVAVVVEAPLTATAPPTEQTNGYQPVSDDSNGAADLEKNYEAGDVLKICPTSEHRDPLEMLTKNASDETLEDNLHCGPESPDEISHMLDADVASRSSETISSQSHAEKSHTRERIVKTVAIMFVWFSVGLSSACYGPALVSLEIMLETNTKTISSVFTFRAVGYLVGSVICGMVYCRLNKELLFGFMMLGLALSTVLIPYSGYVYVLIIISIFSGFFRAFPDTGGNTYVMRLWANHKARDPLMQALHSMWSIGSTLSPFIIVPFLVDVSGFFVVRGNNNGTLCNVTVPEWPTRDRNRTRFDSSSVRAKLNRDDLLEVIRQHLNESTEEYVNVSADAVQSLDNAVYDDHDDDTSWGFDFDVNIREQLKDCISNLTITDIVPEIDELKKLIKTPYVILAVIIISSGVFFFVIYFSAKSKCAVRTITAATATPEAPKPARQDKRFRIQMLALMFAFFVMYQWLEAVPGRFVAVFVVKGLGWRNKYGALITSLYWGSNVLGQLIGIPLSTVMKARNMLITDLLITTFAVILLWFSPLHDSIAWVGSAILGYGLATVFASVILWVDDYVEVTGVTSAVFLAGASCGSMTAPLLTGVLFDDFGYMWFVYILFIADSLVVLIYTGALICGKRHGKRQKPTKDGKQNSGVASNEEHVKLHSIDNV